MSGQGANMSRAEVIAKTKAIEFGPGKTQGGSSSPNTGGKGMDVKVPTGQAGK